MPSIFWKISSGKQESAGLCCLIFSGKSFYTNQQKSSTLLLPLWLPLSICTSLLDQLKHSIFATFYTHTHKHTINCFGIHDLPIHTTTTSSLPYCITFVFTYNHRYTYSLFFLSLIHSLYPGHT